MTTQKPLKRPPETQSKTSGGGDLPQFVSCELNDDEKAFVKQHVVKADEFLDQLDELIQEGYKFSFSYDERSDAIQLVGTGAQTLENKGFALSARAPGILPVWSVWVYKHYEKLKGQWSSAKSVSRKDAWG